MENYSDSFNLIFSLTGQPRDFDWFNNEFIRAVVYEPKMRTGDNSVMQMKDGRIVFEQSKDVELVYCKD